MAAQRNMAPAPWTRPGAPRAGARPSWIGMPRVSASAAPPAMPSRVPVPVLSSRPPTMRSIPPGGEGAFSAPSTAPKSAPGSGSGSYMAIAAGSVRPQIVTTREVELESEVALLRGEITMLGEALASAREQVLVESESEIVRLAFAIARRVVGQELRTDPAIVGRWIKEGLGLLPGREDATVAVSSDVGAVIAGIAKADPVLGGALVDGDLDAGSCELREGTSTVEVGAEGRLAAIADALGVDQGQ